MQDAIMAGDPQIIWQLMVESRQGIQGHLGVVLVVLVALLLVAVQSLRGSLGWVAVLLPLSLFWVVINKPVEGPILLSFTKEHGVTAADLLSLIGIGLAVGRVAFGKRDTVSQQRAVQDWSVLGPMAPAPRPPAEDLPSATHVIVRPGGSP